LAVALTNEILKGPTLLKTEQAQG